MNVDEFTPEKMGHFVPFKGIHPFTDEKYDEWSFIPNPLPNEITLSTETHNLIAEASHRLGELEASLKRLPDPQILVRPAFFREAHSTSAMEGTYAPILEVFEGDLMAEGSRSSEIREILNYVKAAEAALEMIAEKPINLNMLSNLQGIIVEGTEGSRSNQGEIRTTPVIIGDRSRKVADARFIPCPPGDELIAGYSEWEKWIHSENNIPKIAKVALAHYQFETLHPYADGNGRVGRLVISLQLVGEKLLALPLLNLSEWFYKDEMKYKDELLELSKRGDFERWISYFTGGVTEQCNRETKIIDDLIDFQANLINELQLKKERGIVLQLARDLIRNPVFTVPSTAKLYGVTYPPALAAVKKLLALGVIKELSRENVNKKRYFCPEFFQIVS